MLVAAGALAALPAPSLRAETPPAGAPDAELPEAGGPGPGASAPLPPQPPAARDETPAAPHQPADEAAAEEEDAAALLDRLAAAGETEWPGLQQKIMAVWARSESPAMTLLLARATRAMEAEDYDRALLFLDDLVRLAPDFAEGWNRRATVYFLQGRYGRSVADIQRVLALEPRHFGALAGLGIILDRLEQPAQALSVFRRALEVHPNLVGAQQAVERLTPIVEGREL